MPIITISRGFCSGGARLAQLLHERLGWPVLSQEDVSAAAAKAYHMSEEELFRGLYLPANLYERFTHRKTRYLLATQATITGLLPEGNGIYHGLGGQFLLQDQCNAFKVRIVTPFAMRVETAMQRMSMTREEATQYIRVGDDHRLHWGRQIFDADVNDPDLYDLVVKLDQVSLDAAAKIIAEIVQARHQPTDECLQEYRDFSLEKRIRAELFFNSPFTPDLMQVSVKNGEVRLTGGRASEASETRIIEFISKIPGVTTIHTDRDTIEAAEVQLFPHSALSSVDTTAADVMLAIDRYPHCRVDCTIREAMVALGASSVRFDDDHFIPPRYLLIHDSDDRLVGIVSRREILKGLIPHLAEDRAAAANIQDLLPFTGELPCELFRWTSFFSKAAIDAARASIESVMVPIKGTVKVDDSLSTVVTTMLCHGVDLVAVLDGPRVVGVVLMTDIFDIVSQFVIEYGPRDTKGDDNG